MAYKTFVLICVFFPACPCFSMEDATEVHIRRTYSPQKSSKEIENKSERSSVAVGHLVDQEKTLNEKTDETAEIKNAETYLQRCKRYSLSAVPLVSRFSIFVFGYLIMYGCLLVLHEDNNQAFVNNIWAEAARYIYIGTKTYCKGNTTLTIVCS